MIILITTTRRQAAPLSSLLSPVRPACTYTRPGADIIMALDDVVPTA